MPKLFQLGRAKVEITPEFPVHLITLGEGPREPQGITHRLHARVLVLQGENRSGQSETSIIVSADIIFFPTNSATRLRERISRKWGVVHEAILLNATHTHSAPYPAFGYQASAVNSENDAEYDRFIRRVEDQIIIGIQLAMAKLEPATLERGSGTCTFSSFRRKQINGQWVMAPDEHGPTDPEVIVVRFTNSQGNVLALMVSEYGRFVKQ